ncbi:SPOR domain-containing protein [Candidatus Haliotispira prima]|uniref:SPOR domain-containing protein n=1 Tax=Candidatus Haliotispira prima TaxID=3034016 RepID=A0ABY8MM16_9SPIO|nr:SPOR domain-containing protein [Candidatus Haliotispira prima]
MKRILSALFFWGAVGLSQPLFADVVYRLSILVDSNLDSSIALINLFPGNSSVSITNPDSGRREIFTVQQRTSIGRKVALSPDAAGRLGLGEGSVAEVRIVELALNGETLNRNINPAAEYQDIVASPVGTENSFTRPVIEPEPLIVDKPVAPNTGDYNPADRLSNPTVPSGVVNRQLLSDTVSRNSQPAPFSGIVSQNSQPTPTLETSVTGLPPEADTPVRAAPSRVPTNSSNIRDDSLLIDTKDERLRIPLLSGGNGQTTPQNPAPSTRASRGPVVIEPPKDRNDVEKPEPSVTLIPPGDPFTSRAGDSSTYTEKEPVSKPQLGNADHDRRVPPPLEQRPIVSVVSPFANPNAAKPEFFEDPPEFSPALRRIDPNAKEQKFTEPKPVNEIFQPMGDALPIGGHKDAEPTNRVAPPIGNIVTRRPADLAVGRAPATSGKTGGNKGAKPAGITPSLNNTLARRSADLPTGRTSATPLGAGGNNSAEPAGITPSLRNTLERRSADLPTGRAPATPLETSRSAGRESADVTPFANNTLTRRPADLPSGSAPATPLGTSRNAGRKPADITPFPDNTLTLPTGRAPATSLGTSRNAGRKPADVTPFPDNTLTLPTGRAPATPLETSRNAGRNPVDATPFPDNTLTRRPADLPTGRTLATPLKPLRYGYESNNDSETRETEEISGKPEIYFPTVGDMNPPPGSGNGGLFVPQATVATKPSLDPEEPKKDKRIPISPSGDNRRPRRRIQVPSSPRLSSNKPATDTPRPPVTPVQVQVIGNLRNLNLPHGYYIQLASFRDVRKTKQVYKQFVDEYKMNVIPAKIDGKKYYRCLIGNLKESEVAETLRRVRTAGYTDAFVYQNY